MISRKYTSDYKLENELTTDGKMKTVPIYIGKRFVFKANDGELRKTRNKIAVLTVISMLMIVSCLSFYSNIGKTMYVALPYAIAFLPLGFQIVAILNIFTIKTPFTREQKDKTYDRLSACSFFCAVFSAIALVGSIVAMAINGRTYINVNNIMFIILLIIFFISELLIFLNRKKVEMMD